MLTGAVLTKFDEEVDRPRVNLEVVVDKSGIPELLVRLDHIWIVPSGLVDEDCAGDPVAGIAEATERELLGEFVDRCVERGVVTGPIADMYETSDISVTLERAAKLNCMVDVVGLDNDNETVGLFETRFCELCRGIRGGTRDVVRTSEASELRGVGRTVAGAVSECTLVSSWGVDDVPGVTLVACEDSIEVAEEVTLVGNREVAGTTKVLVGSTYVTSALDVVARAMLAMGVDATVATEIVLVADGVYVSALLNAADCFMKTPGVLVVHGTVSVFVTSTVAMTVSSVSSWAKPVITEVHGL